MSLTVTFQCISYTIQITDHARTRMVERKISDQLLVTIIETGQVKPKPTSQANAFWVFKEIAERTDNLVCVSLVLELSSLVIKTVLIDWRPQ